MFFASNFMSRSSPTRMQISQVKQLQRQEDAEPEPDTSCPGPEDPTDFLGRLLEVGDIVETLRTLYRSQGDDVRVQAGWRGVIVKMDGAGDVLVDFGEGSAKKWVRRKHLGTLKKPEEDELQECCMTPEANDSFLTYEPPLKQCQQQLDASEPTRSTFVKDSPAR